MFGLSANSSRLTLNWNARLRGFRSMARKVGSEVATVPDSLRQAAVGIALIPATRKLLAYSLRIASFAPALSRELLGTRAARKSGISTDGTV